MRAYGLEPDTRTGGERLEWSDLTRRREELGRIRNTSAPVMDRLYASLGLAGCSVFLSDVQGVVIDHRMADADEEYFSGAGLCEGGDWSEAAQGTNGIGTCIVEQRTVTIYRDQHFRDSNTVMSCMGAPVFDESGGLAAVLDISSFREDLTQPFATLIAQAVTDAARQIEADHFQSVFAERRIIRGAGDGQRGAVLLAVDSDDLVVGATRAARQVYGLTDESFRSPRPAGDVFGDSARRGVGLDSAERRELIRAIARANGNMTAVAQSLGISRATLYRRMERHGLSRN